jgi:hypothetical protein
VDAPKPAPLSTEVPLPRIQQASAIRSSDARQRMKYDREFREGAVRIVDGGDD